MSIRTKIILSATAIAAALAPASADVREDVSYLASEVCAGRKTGTPGAVEASWYIAARMRSLGYEPEMEAFASGGATGHNIICENAGKGPVLVIMAHYDGFGSVPAKTGGAAQGYVPGADANASGVAGLLYLAENLRGCGLHIVFAALDGHHSDLAGARALKKSLGRTKIRMVINLETLGSSLAPVKPYYRSYFIILGGEPYRKRFTDALQDLPLKLYYDYYGSREFTRLFYTVMNDQAPFLEAGVPSLMLTSGITSNNGSPADSPETLDYGMFTLRLELTERFIRNLPAK